MPLYEYRCRSCRHSFEQLVSISKAGDVSCPNCRAKNIEKRVSSFGIGGGHSRLQNKSSSCTSCTSKNCTTCR
ncbi:MAG: zinc ribbon domain-containing protein [Candidatus Aminicenantes bacterium]|nr:zinc ribbon domain-containing protein [Candidatus Aminicenantes bacterium]